MKKKIGILCGLLVCLILLLVILIIKMTGSNVEEKIDYNSQGVLGTENTESEEMLTGEDLAWASYNEVRNAIVKIDMGDFSGSGVILEITDTEIVIASSGHLLSHYDSGAVMFSNGAVSVGWVKGISETYDVGFMIVYSEDISSEKLSMLKAAAYEVSLYEQLEKGTEVFQVGSTSGVAADFYMGTVLSREWYLEEFESYMLYNFCKATPGMSGGGCFTYDGYFVGLISGSYLEESCALPLAYVLEAKQEIMGH